MTVIISNIISELRQSAEQKYKEGAEHYFKEGIVLYGVRLPAVRKIAAKHWKLLPLHDKKEVFRLCEQLLKNDKHETHVVAFQWAYAVERTDALRRQRTQQYAAKDFAIFERWLKKYVNNWAKCDDLCGGALGHLICKHPELLPKVFRWTKHSNRWLRRASAVSLIISLRKGLYLEQAFRTASALLTDKDDLVQKGYGWMLKEAAKKHQKEVFAYVISNKSKMPRTALRYAIEKMPMQLRKKAMN